MVGHRPTKKSVGHRQGFLLNVFGILFNKEIPYYTQDRNVFKLKSLTNSTMKMKISAIKPNPFKKQINNFLRGGFRFFRFGDMVGHRPYLRFGNN